MPAMSNWRNIWPINHGNSKRLAQITPMRPGFIQRQRLLPACPQFRGRGKKFQALRKVLLGPSRREIRLLGQSHARARQQFFRSLSLPDLFSEKRRTFIGKSGSPRPRISSICVVMAPTAPPDSRKTKRRRGSNDDAPNLRPTLDDDSTEFARNLCGGR